MKIISLNTWVGVVREPLLEFFRTHKDTDIFCLQEVYKDAVGKRQPHPVLNIEMQLFEKIESVLNESHIGFFRPSVEDYYGLAIFVRKGLEVLEEGDLVIYDNPDWTVGESRRGKHGRNLQYVLVSIGERPVLITNVHGLWTNEGKIDIPTRIEQSKRIRDFISQRTGSKVLIGDFNLNPDTESLAIAGEGMKNLIKEYGIVSTRTSFYEKEGKFADYAFISPDLEVLDFKVLPDEVSDHAALYLEVQ